MTRQMVCEGRCSPMTGAFDVAASRYREAFNRSVKGSTALDPALLDLVRETCRRLVHTAHDSELGKWRCRGCGTVRT